MTTNLCLVTCNLTKSHVPFSRQCVFYKYLDRRDTQIHTNNYKRTIKRLYSVSFRFHSFQDLHWLYSFRSLCAFLASPGCRYLLICGQQWTTVGDLWGPMGTSPHWGSPSTYHSWKDVWGDYLIICDYQVSRCFTLRAWFRTSRGNLLNTCAFVSWWVLFSTAPPLVAWITC